ncbi:MAG: hypothetical protein Q8Q85_14085, partial [Gemmatimonadales bacterium]|nr:hypothetical protein [Gemmatimonadales bacterium]
MRHRLLVALLAVGLAAPLAAQTESNLYLPINSWSTPYVEHLIRAGVLQGLDPLTRPLRRADVARAVKAADTTDLAEPVRASLRLLAEELAERPDTVRWKLEANVAVLGASDASRWTVRPAPENTGLFYEGGLAGSLEFPHVAMATHPYFDTRLRRDPEFTGRQDRFIAGDNGEAYILGSWRYLEVFFGLVPRNWGPPEIEGLILSPSPYPYDHLLVRLGPRRFRLEMLAAQLDNLPMWDSPFISKRFLSVHRLVAAPSDRLSFSLSEAALYADNGEPNRNFEPWFLNPLNLWLPVMFNYVHSANILVAGDVSYLIRDDLRAAVQLYVDDIQVDRRTQGDRKPAELGYTLSVTGGASRARLSWSALYTRVDNLDYRTQANEEQYTMRGVGLARSHDDYDQLTLRATTSPAPRAMLTGVLTYLWQGEGSIAKRFPPINLLADSLRFLT